MAPKHRCTPLTHRLQGLEAISRPRCMNADDFRVGVFHGDEDIGPAFPDGDRLRHVRSPHFIDLIGDDRPIVRLGLCASPAPALAERSGAASGLRPSSFVMWNTPVEVQFTSAGCLNYPCRTPAQLVQAVSLLGEMEGGEAGLVGLLSGPTAE